MKSNPWTVGVVVVLLGMAPLGAETISGAGDGLLVAKSTSSQELGDGTSWVTLGNRQVLLAEDSSHPFHRLPIDCDGVCHMDGESGTCMGYCAGIDADGDMAMITWTGQTSGTWKLVGGTGKFDGASGGGGWKEEGAVGAGFTHNSWQGTIELK